MKHLLTLSIILCLSIIIGSQAIAAEFSYGADVMNRYVWRGRDYGNSPNIQPYLEFNAGGFTAGSWGAFSIDTDVYQELDLYVNYNIADIVTIGVTDYFFPDYKSMNPAYSTNYFNYNNDETGHIVEGNLMVGGWEAFPVTLAAHVAFYGADKNKDGDQNYSTYFEVGYSGTLNETNYIIYLGLTPEAGLYGDGFGVVNLGLNLMKEIKITESFSLPIMTGLLFNPQDENAFLLFGFRL